jgi:hypothetical protein
MRFGWSCLGFVVEMELNATANYFFQGDTRGFMFGLIDVDAGPCATLQLLAALRGQND